MKKNFYRVTTATAVMISVQLFSGVGVLGWWSMSGGPIFDNTHSILTNDAVDAVQERSPDMMSFKDILLEAAATTKMDLRSHRVRFKNGIEMIAETAPKDEVTIFNGKYRWKDNLNENRGDVEGFWEQARRLYEKNTDKDLNQAYIEMGQVLHLVEDMAVPAHAYDINHEGLFNMDALEEFAAKSNLEKRAVTPVNYNSVTEYYQEAIKSTRAAIENNMISAPPNEKWTDYWKDGEYGKKFSRHAIGNYGTEKMNLVNSRIQDAKNHGAGVLKYMSYKLPPLAKDFKAETGVMMTGNKNKISALVRDNRTSDVDIALFVVDLGTSSKDLVYQEKGFQLDKTKKYFEKQFTYDWDGKLANGTQLKPGKYELFIQVIDADGNCAPEHCFDKEKVEPFYRTQIEIQ